MKPLLLTLALLLSGCAGYQATVAGRSDSISGYAKEGQYGAAYTHSVTYR